jgi:hypothetical protein
MKVTITAYGEAAQVQGQTLGLSGRAISSQKLTAAGSASALPDETRYVRIATDTAIHVKMGAGAADTDPMMPVGSVEYFGAGEGVEISIIAA